MGEKEMLIAAILSLSGVIVWLAIYIVKLHKKGLEMAVKFSEAINQFKGAMDILTKSVDGNTIVTSDLHKYILSYRNNVLTH